MGRSFQILSLFLIGTLLISSQAESQSGESHFLEGHYKLIEGTVGYFGNECRNEMAVIVNEDGVFIDDLESKWLKKIFGNASCDTIEPQMSVFGFSCTTRLPHKASHIKAEVGSMIGYYYQNESMTVNFLNPFRKTMTYTHQTGTAIPGFDSSGTQDFRCKYLKVPADSKGSWFHNSSDN